MIISVSNLKPGMIVAKDIYTTDGKVCILRNGVELTDTLIRNLVRYKVKEVSVTLSPELMELMKYDVGVVETINAEQKEEIYEAIVTQNMKSIVNSSCDIVSKILSSNGFSYDLSQYKKDDDEFRRSVRVSIFAAEIGNRLNFLINRDNRSKLKNIDLKVLVGAALLYNIGSLCQNKREFERINKYPRILPESVFSNVHPKAFIEFDPKMKTLYSYNMLCNVIDSNINEVLKMTVVTSLEQPNGEGPLGAVPSYMSQSKTNILAGKIIKTCDEFDKLLKKYIKNNADLRNVSVELREKARKGELDNVIVELLLWVLPIYCVGCKVLLSDGNYAVVDSISKSSPCSPIVKIIGSDELLDLGQCDITIKSVVGDEVSFADLLKDKPVVLRPKM